MCICHVGAISAKCVPAIQRLKTAMVDAAPSETAWPPRRVALATLVVVAVTSALVLLYLFSNVLFLLFIGIVLAIALRPLVALLERGGLSRATASVAVYIVLGGLLLAGAWFALPAVYSQTAALVESLPHTYRQLRDYLRQVPSEVVSRFAESLPARLSGGSAPARAQEAINAVTRLFTYAGPLAQSIYVVVATVLLAFYWSLYEDRTIRSLLLLAPPVRRDDARELVDRILAKLGAYLRAQGLLCLIMGGLVFAAYWLIGVPYSLSLGVIAGLFEALPVFGPVLAAIPALLVALSVNPSTALWALGAVVVLQQFESNVLVPRLMDRTVGVNAIVTLLSIAALSALWGLAGAILAIPLAAIAQLGLDRWVFRLDAVDLLPPTGRDAASVLRYELGQLLQDVQTEFRRKERRVSRRSDRLEEEVESLAGDLDRALRAATLQQAAAAVPPAEASP
jgi:predicted PurR-regulated permease PerM